VKEHAEVKNSKMNLIADRGTGKEELDVKIQKEDAKKTPKNPKKKIRTTKLLNYAVSHSSASTYKDGVRNVKGRPEIKNSEMNMVSHKVYEPANLARVLYRNQVFT